MRNIVVLLAIVSVLACPYECAVKLAAAQVMGGDKVAACCDKCRTRETTAPVNDHTPSPPAPDEDGRWCLCEGVVFDPGARSLIDDSVEASLGTWAIGSAKLLNANAPTPNVDCAALPPPLDGRLTRISIRSLLL